MRTISICCVSMVVAACGGADGRGEAGGGASGGVPTEGEGEGAEGGAIEVAGLWESEWGGLHRIDDAVWGDAAVVSHDNAANTAVTRNRADDSWNPGKFARVQWTEPGPDGSFHHCVVAFGKATEEEAAADPAAVDPSAPAAGGCGGFPWTRLFDPIEVAGHYEDQFGFALAVSTGSWGDATVVSFDGEANVAVTQNAADAAFDPGKFNRIVWTEPAADGAFHYCTVAFGKASAAEAEADPAAADASAPDAGGCGGFPWSRMTPTVELFGAYDDDLGGAWQIGGGRWGDWTVVSYTNDFNRAIVQYAADDEFNPSGFSKVVWTDRGADGVFWYCSVNFGKATADEADADPTSWDSSAPAERGCGGFPWTRLAPKAPAPDPAGR